MEHTPVLIIGGSLVGLSASLFLAWRGIPHILVEKHFGSALHPRAMGFTETTIEHYRTVGIADSIPQAPKGACLRRVKVKNLSSEWISESDWTPGQAVDRSDDLSPCRGLQSRKINLSRFYAALHKRWELSISLVLN